MKHINALEIALTVSSLAVLNTVAPLNAQTLTTLSSNGGVVAWSVQTNTPSWNQALGIKATRQGCPDAPTACMTFVGNLARTYHVQVTLDIPLTTATPTNAKQYSVLSRTGTFLREVSFDDFVDQFKALPSTLLVQPWTYVGESILNLKSANPNLAFGITLYEDQLTSPYLQNAKLPAAIRANVNYVHLYLHYRENGPNYASYVLQAKQLFPHAHIVAGSYAYDRRAYLPCAPGGVACTTQQDIDLFKQSLTIQAQEMRQGVVDHIEFYPGYFGNESTWPSWSDPRKCAPGDLTACLDNTMVMRDAALEILNTVAASTPTWKQLAPTGTLPAARYGQSTAIDPGSHRMILFGGSTFSSQLNDTWILTGADGQHGASAWIPVAATNPPPATSYSQGMYDAANNRMIVYGGTAMTDVWVLTNANSLGSTASAWVKLPAIGPLPPVLTDYEKQAYDLAQNILIVFDSTAGVWALTHANGLGGTPVWSQLNPAGAGPSGRSAFTVVYNPVSNRLMVFGGSDGTTDFNDLWALTNANGIGGTPQWIPLPTGTATVPLGRSLHTAVYDPLSDTMTIFGGNGLPAETWTATNASGLTQPPTWRLVNPGTTLDPLVFESAALDTNSLSMVIFGGLGTNIENSVFVLWPVL